MKKEISAPQLTKYSTFTLLFGIMCFFGKPAYAQSMIERELGLRFSGLDKYNLVYKVKDSENFYWRYTLGALNLGFSDVSNGYISYSNLGIAFSVGGEKRSKITEQLKFIHGLEPSFSFGIQAQNNAHITQYGVGLGYVLGFQYDFSDKFYMNIESVPSVNLNITNTGGSVSYYINSGLNSSGLALSLVYKFKTENKY